MKTIERAHLPNKMWEKIRLPKNYEKALGLIDENLEEWAGSKFQRHKCKQRLTKLHQMIRRKRKIKISSMHNQEELVVINKKYEKRENKREAKAEQAAQLDVAIEKQLLERLKSGTFYPKEIYNLNPNDFETALNEQEVEATEYNVEDEDEEDLEDESDMEGDLESLDEDEELELEQEEEKDANNVEDLAEYLSDQEQ
jgi:protein MAK16